MLLFPFICPDNIQIKNPESLPFLSLLIKYHSQLVQTAKHYCKHRQKQKYYFPTTQFYKKSDDQMSYRMCKFPQETLDKDAQRTRNNLEVQQKQVLQPYFFSSELKLINIDGQEQYQDLISTSAY